MSIKALESLVTTIVASEKVQGLWRIRDRGMPVFVHTIDVVLLCLEAFPEWRERYPKLNLEAITVGGLLHDLTKLSARESHIRSHSTIMKEMPEQAISEAVDVLDAAQLVTGPVLSPEEVDHIWHIIVSHHGVWGKVQPHTPEAALVHQCDLHSAMRNRCSPVDANDILPLLNRGHRLAVIAAQLGVGTSVVRMRLGEACRWEHVPDWPGLLEIWLKRGHVVCGGLDRMRQMERIKLLMKLAAEAPGPILEALRRCRNGRDG
ncbi:MAG: HD domain-containing protein [Chloroflexi bacterium]|nr:HD domain-containing protein [Chloroflexota bacterium]